MTTLKQIKEDYFLISKERIVWFILALVIAGLIYLAFYIAYDNGRQTGRNEGWDNADRAIIDKINKYGSVKLAWSNGTQIGIELEEYKDYPIHIYNEINWSSGVKQ